MRMPTTSANITVFLLFFGIALLEAFRTRDWFWAGFWVLAGLAFLALDRWGHRRGRKGESRIG
jgi:apolipoprotein N-acyltransferase